MVKKTRKSSGTLDGRLSKSERMGRGASSAPKRNPTQSNRKPGTKTQKTSSSKRRTGKGRRRSSTARRGRIWSLIKSTLYWGSVTAIWGFILLAGVLAYYAAHLPQTSQWRIPERPPNVKILASDGSILSNRGDTGGEAIRLEHLPAYLPDAVIAIEDRRFHYHFGIDPIGLMRAMATNLMKGGLRQGGSTLTQQLAKNLFLTPDKTFKRKVQEAILAIWLEANYSKNEIIEMYLNRVYLGAGAYGVDAAARRYYGKSAREVTLAEAAVLAGLLKAPSRYAPTRSEKRAQARSAVVLQAMARSGFISKHEAKIALSNPAMVVDRYRQGSANYIADWAMDMLDDYVPSIDQDIIVKTTIDPHLQRQAEQVIAQQLNTKGKALRVNQGVLVAMDPSGAIKAMIGGRSYAKSQFNRAVYGKRQPGSAFKPFVYLTALERGMRPETIRHDGPISINGWRPKNYSKTYQGDVSLTTAFAFSLNTVAARIAQEVGPGNVVKVAKRLGIRSKLHKNPSIALGTAEVSPLELTAAYVPFANGGYGIIPHVIDRIQLAHGRVLYERRGSGIGRIIKPQTVSMMNRMMAATLTIGTGKKAKIPNWQAAGKTGTSQDFRDAWFIGYTAHLVTGIWFGNDNDKPTKRVSGGSLAADAWQKFMIPAHKGIPLTSLPGVTDTPITAIVHQKPPDIPVNRTLSTQSTHTPINRPWRDETGQSQAQSSLFERLFGGR